jgi:hypothetical protein
MCVASFFEGAPDDEIVVPSLENQINRADSWGIPLARNFFGHEIY